MSLPPLDDKTAQICKQFGVGLTGGIATGKSTVKNFFIGQGIKVFDADAFARSALDIGSYGFAQFVKIFGNGFFSEGGLVDRAKLGKYIFANENARKQLEQIIHPEIRKSLANEVAKIDFSKDRFFIFEASLLIETGLYLNFAEIWCTNCSRETQLLRLQSRNNISLEAAQKIIASQISQEKRAPFVDIAIDTGKIFDISQVKKSKFI